MTKAECQLPTQSLTFAPIDFEQETLSNGLAATGFDPARPAFFTWLGVVPYLREGAVSSTLHLIASLPKGAHVVFDYSDPPDSLSPEARAYHDRRAARVRAVAESWGELLRGSVAILSGKGRRSARQGRPRFACRHFVSRGPIKPASWLGRRSVRMLP